MMLMVTATYPTSSLSRVAEVTSETMKDKLPEYMKVVGWFNGTGGEGIESHTIYRIDDDKVALGMNTIAGWLMRYFPVEGYKVKTEFVSGIEEMDSYRGRKIS